MKDLLVLSGEFRNMTTTEGKRIVSSNTLIPLGLVFTICAGVVWISNELNQIRFKLEQLDEKMENLWTQRDMENWALKFKLANPDITIPDF